MAVTLGTLRARFIDRCDEGQSTYFQTGPGNGSADPIADLINEAYTQLYSIYARKDPWFFASTRLDPVTAGSDNILPLDFREMLTPVYFVTSSTVDPALQSHTPMERWTGTTYRGKVDFATAGWCTEVPRYDIIGSNIRFDPIPTSAYGITYSYIPQCTPLVLDTDTLDRAIFVGHEQWIVNQAVITGRLAKEEISCVELQAMNDRLRADIEMDLLSRDRGQCKRITPNSYDGGPSYGYGY